MAMRRLGPKGSLTFGLRSQPKDVTIYLVWLCVAHFSVVVSTADYSQEHERLHSLFDTRSKEPGPEDLKD